VGALASSMGDKPVHIILGLQCEEIAEGTGTLTFDGTTAAFTNFTGKLIFSRAPRYSASSATALPSWLSMVEPVAPTETPSVVGKRESPAVAATTSSTTVTSTSPLSKKARFVTPHQTSRMGVATHGIERAGHVAFTAGAPSSLYIWGGVGRGGSHLGDLVTLKIDVLSKTCKASRSLCDSQPRSWAGGAFVSRTKLLVVFGGEGELDEGEEAKADGLAGATCLEDVLCCDPDLALFFPQHVGGKGPTSRSGHATAPLLNGRILVVHGGQRAGRHPYNIHVLDVERFHWTSPKCDGNPPTARSRHTLCAISENRGLVFGGDDGLECFNDVRILCCTEGRTGSLAWSWETPEIQQQAARPEPRTGHAACVLGHGRFVLIKGGSDPYRGGHNFDDSWLLDTSSWSWTRLSESVWTSLALDTSAIPDYDEGNPEQDDSGGLCGSRLTVLSDGLVVQTGGTNANGQPSARVCCSLELDLLKAGPF
jgi:Kelch motif